MRSLILVLVILFSPAVFSESFVTGGIDNLVFTETTYSSASVDSTTQQLLFTGTGKPEVWLVTNPSTNKRLFLKPNDNTTNERGRIVKPGETFALGVLSTLPHYGIMESGGSVTIQVLRIF